MTKTSLSRIPRWSTAVLAACAALALAAAAADKQRTVAYGNTENPPRVDPLGRCDALTLLFYPDTPCEKPAPVPADTAEQPAPPAAAYPWQIPLWEATGQVLAGEPVDTGTAWQASWHHYPAEEGATFSSLTLSLDAAPPEDSRIVAMLRPVDSDDALVLGSDDFPFEVRETSDGLVAQAARSLPPGRYAVVAGLAGEDGNLVPRFAGRVLIPRVAADQLRLSEVILADSLRRVGPDEPPSPFHVSGFEVVPRSSNVFHPGESVKIFYIVLGAGGESVDVDVTYQLYLKNPANLSAGWIRAGRPQVMAHQEGAVRAWELPIVEQFPATDYRLEIKVRDNASGGTVNGFVEFRVEKG